jgi:uncharacterized membrane protein
VVMMGIASPGTHLIVLFALSMSSMSYVVAIREVAIVIASVLGFAFLKEDVLVQKLCGIFVIIASILLIKLAK